MIAFWMQSIVSMIHSAIRGGLMCSRNILTYCSRMNYLHINAEDSYLDEAVGYTLAATGMWFQLSMGFEVFFPFNILLLPFTLTNLLLLWVVNTTQ